MWETIPQKIIKKKAICQNTTEGHICPYMCITVCICVCCLCTLLQWHVLLPTTPSSSLQCWEADPRSEGREQRADKELHWCYLSVTARGWGSEQGGQEDSHGPLALPSFLILTNKCLKMLSHNGRIWAQRADIITWAPYKVMQCEVTMIYHVCHRCYSLRRVESFCYFYRKLTLKSAKL